MLLAWAEQVLRLAFRAERDDVMLSSNSSDRMKVILLKDRVHNHRLGLEHWLLDHNSWLHCWLWVRVGLDNDGGLRLSDDLGSESNW